MKQAREACVLGLVSHVYSLGSTTFYENGSFPARMWGKRSDCHRSNAMLQRLAVAMGKGQPFLVVDFKAAR